MSVRGGGHNIAGLALCDDGVMIDASLMKQITVDLKACTAVADGGLTWSSTWQPSGRTWPRQEMPSRRPASPV